MTYNKKYILLIILFIVAIQFIAGCSYSFTGSSVPPHLKTISIPLFEDRSGSGEPNLREDFTNELIQKFIDDNSLQIVERVNADASLDGTILSLNDAPATIGVAKGNEAITARRITITVKVVYKDYVERKTVFTKNFSDFSDYTNDGDITTKRENAILETVDKITEDILLSVVSNW